MLAADPLRQPAERKAQHRVENGEAQSLQHAELCVGELQVFLDRLGEHRKHRAIGEVHGADDDQHDDEPGLVSTRQQRMDARRRRGEAGGSGASINRHPQRPNQDTGPTREAPRLAEISSRDRQLDHVGGLLHGDMLQIVGEGHLLRASSCPCAAGRRPG